MSTTFLSVAAVATPVLWLSHGLLGLVLSGDTDEHAPAVAAVAPDGPSTSTWRGSSGGLAAIEEASAVDLAAAQPRRRTSISHQRNVSSGLTRTRSQYSVSSLSSQLDDRDVASAVFEAAHDDGSAYGWYTT